MFRQREKLQEKKPAIEMNKKHKYLKNHYLSQTWYEQRASYSRKDGALSHVRNDTA